MATSKTYREYFNINPKYYAAVTPELVEEGKVSWKEFYPHETFLKLLNEINTVLSNKDTRSLWVEGAFGTGKSHAVFTVKKMLEATDEEISAYFDDFKLSPDLCQQIITGKNSGKLLIVERTGSSDIHSDQDLIIKIQESIMSALKEQGIENQGESALKDSTLKWLSDSDNRAFFASKMNKEKYVWDFGGKSLDSVIEILRDGKEEEISRIMRSIMKVAKDNNILAMQMDAQSCADWLADIIDKNNLGAIIFIWDEFTDFFRNNGNSLTGFQTLAALSQNTPFYFMIVTHGSEQLIKNKDDDKKIRDRFLPVVKIELPDNIALKLMHQAMKTTDDKVLADKWAKYAAQLNNDLGDVRKAIVENTRTSDGGKLSDEDLKGIVPMHPFSALVLKNIASVVGSNQRSMFEFIINDNPDAHGFKWFIDNHGPLDNKNLLTVDMLWNFFNLKGQNGQDVVNDAVRIILGNYGLYNMDKYSEDAQRVFKTILLLQAISGQLGGMVELLRPNDRNLELAYLGTDWQRGKANVVAEQLVKDNLLFKQIVGNRAEYTVAGIHRDAGNIQKKKEEILKNMKTSEIAVRAQLMEAINLPLKVKNRFTLSSVAYKDLSGKANRMLTEPIPYGFHVVVVFALDEEESQNARREIEKLVRDERYKGIYFLDATSKFFGKERKEQYASDLAYSDYYLKQNKGESDKFGKRAEDNLTNWRSEIENGSFTLYDCDNPSGIRAANLSLLVEEFLHIEEKFYPYSLAKYSVIENMFNRTAMGQGAGCGIEEKLQGTYKSSNKQTSLDTALSGVWQVKDYWKDNDKRSLPIVKAKIRVEELIEKGFQEKGQVSIKGIFEELRGGKFGYTVCNFTAFVLGFLLKEYANSNYYWTNATITKPMSVDVMKKAIADALNPPKNYKEEFIRAMSPEQSRFLQSTAEIFNIRAENCGSVEQARDNIRLAMKKLPFPLWCLKSTLSKKSLRTNDNTVARTIDCYMGIVNTANIGAAGESDLANEAGQLFIDNAELVVDMKNLVKSDVIVEGMRQYTADFRGGELIDLSARIGTGANYLDEVKRKFNADEANWVWNIETADDKLSDVILEYRIIEESNKSLPRTFSISETARAWNQKTGNLRIAYEALTPEAEGMKNILSLLYKIRQQGVLPEQDKKAFYDALVNEREAFESFYNGQFEYFRKVAKPYLQDLTTEEAEEFFGTLSSNQFAKTRSEYFRYVEEEIKKYTESQAKAKLKKLWLEKTGAKSPRDWSRKYNTPILCMFDENERKKAREVFKTLNSNAPLKDEIDLAFLYLKQANFYDRLNDADERDKRFTERVVGNYGVILKDTKAVRDYLSEKTTVEPYEWMDSEEVRRKLEDFAKREYQTSACADALDIIDGLSERALKQYLKDLVGDSMNVGIEILKQGRK